MTCSYDLGSIRLASHPYLPICYGWTTCRGVNLLTKTQISMEVNVFISTAGFF